MGTRANSTILAGLSVTAAAATIAALPAGGHGLALGDAPTTARSVTLLSHSESWTNANVAGHDDGDDSTEQEQHHQHSGDGDHHGIPLAGTVTNFLDNNQAAVTAFAAQVPAFTIGPVAAGNGVLAAAYYTGYSGSAAGVPGVKAYIAGQVAGAGGVKPIILGVTSKIPTFKIGPVQVGNALVANAYFNGYNGSAAGFPGVQAYIAGQLGGTTPAGAASASGRAVKPAAAVASLPVTANTAAVSAPSAKPTAANHATPGVPKNIAKTFAASRQTR